MNNCSVILQVELSSPFANFSEEWKGRLTSLLLSNFIISDVLRNALFGILEVGVKFLSGNRVLTESIPMMSDHWLTVKGKSTRVGHPEDFVISKGYVYYSFSVQDTSSRLEGACAFTHYLW